MIFKKPKVSNDRPNEQTPYGLLYSDTDTYARYVEALRVRDWLAAFLSDMDRLRLNPTEAIKRIDDFSATLAPHQGSLKSDHLDRLRASLAETSPIPFGSLLTGLRVHVSQHWGAVVASIAQDCERVPTGLERPYTGPFQRDTHTPAYGYYRAMADNRN